MENLSRSHFAHDMLPHSVRRMSIARRFLRREVFSGGQRLVQSTAPSIQPRATATFRYHKLPSAEPRSSPSRPISIPMSIRRRHLSIRIDTSMHTDSNYRAASFVYGLADSTLLMGQRLILCSLICPGCDSCLPRAKMDSSRGFTLSSMVIRIARNFYFILRGLRKWLAINFNDGIIPVPAVQPIRRVRAHRSTPRRDAVPHDYLADMARLHGPVRPCYIGSDEPIPLFRLLAGAAPSKLNLNHSDPLPMSSSMSDIMSGLVEASTDCLVGRKFATEEVDEDGKHHDDFEFKSFISPAVQPIHQVVAHRSTPPRDAITHNYFADMARLHSPVHPCYIGPDEPTCSSMFTPSPTAIPSLTAEERDFADALHKSTESTSKKVLRTYPGLARLLPALDDVKREAHNILRLFKAQEEQRDRCFTICIYDVAPLESTINDVHSLIAREDPTYLICRNVQSTDVQNFGYKKVVCSPNDREDDRQRCIIMCTSETCPNLGKTSYGQTGRCAVFTYGLLTFIVVDASSTGDFRSEEARLTLLDHIRHLAEQHLAKKQWVMVVGATGIYPSTFDYHDEYPTNAMTAGEAVAIKSLRKAGLKDAYRVLYPEGTSYSRYCNPREAAVGCRNDVFWLDKHWMNRLVDVEYLPNYHSNDNAPVMVTFSVEP